MAYRRLPTTDKARHLALEKMSELLNKDELGVLLKKERRIKELKSEFGDLLSKREQLAEHKKALNVQKNNLSNRLRLYISHYLQVINFSIERGEIDKMIRKHYGLEVNMGNLPELSSIDQLLFWVEKIKKGEHKRVSLNQPPISHPKVEKIEELKELLIVQQKNLLKIEQQIGKNKLNIANNRVKLDQFIKQTWNEIEAKFSNETIAVKQQKAVRYGVVYVN